MKMNDTPTYASLTPLAPVNPSIMNGLAELSSVQSMTNHSMMNSHDLLPMGLLNSHSSDSVAMGMSTGSNHSNDSINSSSSLAVLSPAAPGTPTSSVMSDMKSESGEGPPLERGDLIAVLQFLKKNSLKGTEDLLRRECGFFDEVDESKANLVRESDSTMFSSYKNEGDPTEYEEAYQNIVNFVERSMDVYKNEVAQVLYPVFVHMYLELVYNNHENMAIAFLERFSHQQEDYYQEDILSLSLVTTKDNMTGYQIMDTFRSSQFSVRISRDSYSYLKRFLSEKVGGGPVPRIIQDRLSFDVFDGVPRSRAQVKAAAGALEGEASRQVNKNKMYYGLLKEPELQNLINEEEEGDEDIDKPKKKKTKKDSLQKNKKNDPNAPPNVRIPLPDLRDIDKLEKAKSFRDAIKRATLNKDNLPSICFYTFLNASSNLSSLDITDDTSLLAFGLADSAVKVQSITPARLKAMKSVEQLDEIDKDADDVLVRMMDERSAEQTKELHGHSGPVYGCSFSPDRALLLTCGKDGTIRLWSLQTWTCLVIYKGHIFPVWDVKFSSLGYYFASGGHDRTARLWATDHHQPLRIFSGHYSDVEVVHFHPNCNYIASGSSDRTVRIWDNLTGNCVRILNGHKGNISCLSFSPCGRYLASGSADSRVLIWDMSNGTQVAEMASHSDTVYTLSFSRDSTLLASGGLDNAIKLWDFSKITDEMMDEDSAQLTQEIRRTQQSLLVATFPTKSTSVLCVHFTRRNVLLASGAFQA